MLLSFQAVFPLLAYMLIGLFLRKISLLDEKTASGMNKLVFRVFLPLSIFQSIYNADIHENFNSKLALFAALTCILSFLIISLIVKHFEKDRTIMPVMIQGIHKANYNLLAIPIVSSFYGNEIGMTAVLVAVITPIVNTCSTIAFESARGGKVDFRKMLKKILLNPMVYSSLLGLVVSISGIRIPALIMNSVVSKLGAMATPAAMLALGAGFDFTAMKKWAGRLGAVFAGKLVILPLLIVTAAALLGFRKADLLAVLIYSGAPTAVNSYSTAVSMGGNEELAGEIVAGASLLSVLTLFIFMTVMGRLGLL